MHQFVAWLTRGTLFGQVAARIHIGEVVGGSVKAEQHIDEVLPASDESE
jgi:hypothetical protein